MRTKKITLIFTMMLFAGWIAAQCLADLTISTIQDETEVEICLGSSNTSVTLKPGTFAGPYAYAITDNQDKILDVVLGNKFDFRDADPGVCRIYGVSWWGNFKKPVGSDISNAVFADYCSEVSTNYIEVTRILLGQGTISDDDGENTVYTCPNDGVADVINFDYDGSSQASFTFLITDESYNILGIPTSSSQDFEGAGEGVCLVWGLNYMGELLAEVGDNAIHDQLASGCFGLSENTLTVVRAIPMAGTMSGPKGSDDLNICVGDGVADVYKFSAPKRSKAQFRLVVTNDKNEIVGLPIADMVDFEEAGAGVCRVWGASFTGDFLLSEGQLLDGAEISDGCFDLSADYISVIRTYVHGGTVSTPAGINKVYTCPQDGSPDFVPFHHEGNSETAYVYIITSPTLEILGIETNDGHDFDDAPPGTCWVWGLAYTGSLTAQVGDHAGEVELSDQCYDLSDNYIAVVRDIPDGGTVSMPSGETERYTCPQNGVGDLVEFRSSGASNSKYAYIITSPQLEILGIKQNNSHDFDESPPGICWVWGIAYTGEITAQVGDTVGKIDLTDDCYDLSENHLTIIRDIPDGGKVNTFTGASTVFTCPQDGKGDFISFTHRDGSNSKYAYIITSPTLEILGVETEPGHDFDETPPGTCWVWAIAYTGELLAAIGMNAGTDALADDCFDLSDNFIEIIRDHPEAGTVSMPSGETERHTCTRDGNGDVVDFVHAGASNSKYAYLITSPSMEILGIETNDSHDFDDAPPSTCWVWGLSYTGNIIAELGDDASRVALTSDCYDLSDNYITVIRETPDGGSVSTPNGLTTTYTCTEDGVGEVVEFVSKGAAGSNFVYLITSPSLEILGIEMNDSHDFDDVPPGTCWVWGLAYTGTLLAQVGDYADSIDLSDECFDLSENYIEVIRDIPEGGQVSMPSGATRTYTCTQDGDGDIVEFKSEGTSNSKYVYIITSPDLEILGIETNDFHDFDNAPPGTCWVWGLAYTGDQIAEIGDDATDLMFSDDCFDLSDNFIEVIRDVPDGGTVSTGSGETKDTVIVGDGTDDFIVFAHTNASNSKYAYVVTDDQNNILSIPNNNIVNFENASPGVCRVWGLSYTGTLLAGTGDVVTSAELSDDCFDLSANFVEVTRLSGVLSDHADSLGYGEMTQDKLASRLISSSREDLVMEVSAPVTKGRFEVIIFDSWGRIIGKEKYNTGSRLNRVEISLQNVSSGVLLISVVDGFARLTTKAMVY